MVGRDFGAEDGARLFEGEQRGPSGIGQSDRHRNQGFIEEKLLGTGPEVCFFRGRGDFVAVRRVDDSVTFVQFGQTDILVDAQTSFEKQFRHGCAPLPDFAGGGGQPPRRARINGRCAWQ